MPASFINLCGQKLVFLYLRGLSKKVTGLGGLHQQNYLKERNFRKLTLASLVAQRLKRLPSMWEIQVRSLGWEDPWRRKWQPTPVFLPGESHGQRSLVGYSPRDRKESDTTERLHFHFHFSLSKHVIKKYL